MIKQIKTLRLVASFVVAFERDTARIVDLCLIIAMGYYDVWIVAGNWWTTTVEIATWNTAE